jgi:polyisoprenoid-binding protein YceI
MKTLLSLAVALAPGLAVAQSYQIDPSHTNVHFAIKHMMSTVHGEFTGVTGKVVLDDKDLTRSSLEAEIDAATVNTREPGRDQHLKSADFFDVANFPKLTFKSTKITRVAKGKYKMAGDLTLRGVTKAVTFDVEGFDEEMADPWGTPRRGGVATATINRLDFGLKWQKPLAKVGQLFVGNEVTITLDVELKKAPAQHASAK